MTHFSAEHRQTSHKESHYCNTWGARLPGHFFRVQLFGSQLPEPSSRTRWLDLQWCFTSSIFWTVFPLLPSGVAWKGTSSWVFFFAGILGTLRRASVVFLLWWQFSCQAMEMYCSPVGRCDVMLTPSRHGCESNSRDLGGRSARPPTICNNNTPTGSVTRRAIQEISLPLLLFSPER